MPYAVLRFSPNSSGYRRATIFFHSPVQQSHTPIMREVMLRRRLLRACAFGLPVHTRCRHAVDMQATFDDTDGDARLYFSRNNSIVSYFVPAGEGCDLRIEPGFLTYPWDFEANYQAVRECVLREAAERLGVPTAEVLTVPFRQMKSIADPQLPEKYRSMFRKRSRGFRIS